MVADTGPLVAAANRRDEAHHLAAALVVALGRDLVIPSPVLVEIDQLLRSRVGAISARLFLAAASTGAGRGAAALPWAAAAGRRDRCPARRPRPRAGGRLMAVAEQLGLPILTFDFADFRAAPSPSGAWQLVVDEARYAEHVEQRR